MKTVDDIQRDVQPYDGGPWAIADLAVGWAKRLGVVLAIAFVIAVIAHQAGVL